MRAPTSWRAIARRSGFDLSVRGIVREGGRPIAGLGFHVPGTDYEAHTDGDGVFQVNLPKGTLGGATASADVIAGQLFTRIGSIVALLRNEQRAEALAALESLLLQAVATAEAPPPAAVSVDALLGEDSRARRHGAPPGARARESRKAFRIRRTSTRSKRSARSWPRRRATARSSCKGREYPELSITVRVQ